MKTLPPIFLRTINGLLAILMSLTTLWLCPTYLDHQTESLQIPMSEKLTDAFRRDRHWPATELPTTATHVTNGVRVDGETDDFFLFGPYASTMAGQYIVRIDGESADKTSTRVLHAQLASHKGTEVHETFDISGNELPFSVTVELPTTGDLEVRMVATSGTTVTIHAVELKQTSIDTIGTLKHIARAICGYALPNSNPCLHK